MKRFKRRSLVLFASVIALGVIGGAGIPWLYSAVSSQDASRPGLGIALAAPSTAVGDAFPDDVAEFSAYLDVGDAIQSIDDLAEVRKVCTNTPPISQTHMVCQVSAASNALSLWNIGLYADTNGLVVAYFAIAGNTHTPTSAAAVWSGDISLPGDLFQPDFESPTLALDDIVRQAVEKVGVDYASVASNTGYFHWEFPAATVLTVITKTENIEAFNQYFFARPNDPIFEASVTGYGKSDFNTIFLDGLVILHTRSAYRGAARGDGFIAPLSKVSPDVLHKVGNVSRHGSAIYLLWTP